MQGKEKKRKTRRNSSKKKYTFTSSFPPATILFLVSASFSDSFNFDCITNSSCLSSCIWLSYSKRHVSSLLDHSFSRDAISAINLSFLFFSSFQASCQFSSSASKAFSRDSRCSSEALRKDVRETDFAGSSFDHLAGGGSVSSLPGRTKCFK